MADVAAITKATKAVDDIVAEQVEQARARKRAIEDFESGKLDPAGPYAKTLAEQTAARKELIRAIEGLQASLKTAEATLAKMDAQAKKDEAAMAAARKGAPADAIPDKAPFLVDLRNAQGDLANKFKFAQVEVANLTKMISGDPTLAGAMAKDHPKAVTLLNQAHDALAEACTQASTSRAWYL